MSDPPDLPPTARGAPPGVELAIPGRTLVAEEKNNDPANQRSLRQTVKDAFDVLEGQLKKAKDRQRGDTKTRELPPHGRVRRLLTDETGVRYGFIESRDGRQIYVHEDALVDLDYEELEIGDEVRLAVAEGDEGPQASTVARLPAPDIGPAQEEEVPLRGET